MILFELEASIFSLGKLELKWWADTKGRAPLLLDSAVSLSS